MVVTLNWNTAEETTECFDSLLAIPFDDFDLTILDNASDDDSQAVIRRYLGDHGGTLLSRGELRYSNQTLVRETYTLQRLVESSRPLRVELIISPVNFGFPGGNNVGIELALSNGYDLILLLNNDTVVDPMCVGELVRTVGETEDIGIVGAKVLFYDKPGSVQTAGGRIHWITGRFENFNSQVDTGQFDTETERDFVFATCMLVRRQVFEQVGLLDQAFVFGIEEFDLCTRATRAGFRVVYSPNARVRHKGGRSAAKLATHAETLTAIQRGRGFLGLRYDVMFFRKHCGPYKAIVPMFFRIGYASAAFVQNVAAVATEGRKVRTEEPTSGVAELLRGDVRRILDRLRFGGQRKP